MNSGQPSANRSPASSSYCGASATGISLYTPTTLARDPGTGHCITDRARGRAELPAARLVERLEVGDADRGRDGGDGQRGGHERVPSAGQAALPEVGDHRRAGLQLEQPREVVVGNAG